MLIKRTQVETALEADAQKHRPQVPSSVPSAEGGLESSVEEQQITPEPVPEPQKQWNLDDFQSGILHDRRGERRRSMGMYRRIEDQEIISQAEEEANAIRERATIEGREQGIQQATQAIEALRGLLVDLLEGKQAALQSLENDIAPIAVMVAEKILQREALCDTELVVGLVREAILRVDKDIKRIMVKVHPDEVDTVKNYLDPNPFHDVEAKLIVLDDPMVNRGSCIIETTSGLVDTTFSTQLSIVRRLLGVTDAGVEDSPDISEHDDGEAR